MTGADRLEDVGQETTDEEDATMASSISLEKVAQREMAAVCQVHHSILTSLTHSDWLQKRPSCGIEKDAMSVPWLMVYGIGSEVMKNASELLGKFCLRG